LLPAADPSAGMLAPGAAARDVTPPRSVRHRDPLAPGRRPSGVGRRSPRPRASLAPLASCYTRLTLTDIRMGL
jgi:hypothetical protein